MSKRIKDLIYAATGIDLNVDALATDLNAQMAVASLLAVAANSDGSIDSTETAKMVEVLCKRFPISPINALDIVTRALDDLARREPSSRLLDELDEMMSLKQKEDVLLMLLEVVAADGIKQGEEMKVVHDSAAALRIGDDRLAKVYARYFDGRKTPA